MVNYDGKLFDIKKVCERCNELNIIYKTYAKQYRYYCNCMPLTDRTTQPTSKKVDQSYNEIVGDKDDK